MDVDVESLLSIINSIWGFIVIIGSALDGLINYVNNLSYQTNTYTTGAGSIGSGYYYSSGVQTTQTQTCDCRFPCNITNTVCKSIAANDDSLFNIINEDNKLVSEALTKLTQNQEREEIVMNNLENQSSQQTISRRVTTYTGGITGGINETSTTIVNPLLGEISLLPLIQNKLSRNLDWSLIIYKPITLEIEQNTENYQKFLKLII